jgi:hypothetical protein
MRKSQALGNLGGVQLSGDRKPRPGYEIDVDKDLFAYPDALKAIEHQKSVIVHAAFADSKYFFRLTSSYEPAGGQHMISSASAEADVRRIERAEAILQANRNYVDSILDDIAYAFQGASNYHEIIKFIELYWWAFPRTSIKIRKDVVIGHMQFLKKQPSGWEPFYDYRKKIYVRLANIWGYPVDDEKDQAVNIMG